MALLQIANACSPPNPSLHMCCLFQCFETGFHVACSIHNNTNSVLFCCALSIHQACQCSGKPAVHQMLTQTQLSVLHTAIGLADHLPVTLMLAQPFTLPFAMCSQQCQQPVKKHTKYIISHACTSFEVTWRATACTVTDRGQGQWRYTEHGCRCGHCQQLSPKWSKVADSLKGIVKVAAVNCEEDKQLCSKHG